MDSTNLKSKTTSNIYIDLSHIKKVKNQDVNDTIFVSEEIKSPNQEGKPSLKLIIRQKKKANIDNYNVPEKSEKSIFSKGQFNNKQLTISSHIDKRRKLDVDQKMSNESIYNRKGNIEQIVQKIDITQMEHATEKPSTSHSLPLLRENDSFEKLHAPSSEGRTFSSSTIITNSFEKADDKSLISDSIIDVDPEPMSLETIEQSKHCKINSENLCTNNNNIKGSHKSLRYNKNKESSQGNNNIILTQCFTSEVKSVKNLDEIITIPCELINSNKKIRKVNNEFIKIGKNKSFSIKNVDAKFGETNACGIPQNRILRSNKSNKNMTQILVDQKNIFINNNIDSRICKEMTHIPETQSTDLKIYTTDICERSSFMVQNDEIITANNDDFDLKVSKPRLLRSHKFRNEISTENLNCDNNHQQLNQNIQGNTENEDTNYIRRILDESFVKTMPGSDSSLTLSQNSSLKKSVKNALELPSEITSTVEMDKCYTTPRLLRSNNKSKQPSVGNTSDVRNAKFSSVDTGHSCELELVKAQQIHPNKKTFHENVHTENEILKVNSVGNQISKSKPEVTKYIKSKQLKGSSTENIINKGFLMSKKKKKKFQASDSLSDKVKLSYKEFSREVVEKNDVSQVIPKKKKIVSLTKKVQNVSDCNIIKDKLKNANLETPPSYLSKENSEQKSQIKKKKKPLPLNFPLEGLSSSEEMLKAVNISKSLKEKHKNGKDKQKSITLGSFRSHENYVNINEENVKNNECNVISCNTFYSNELHSLVKSSSSIKPVNPMLDADKCIDIKNISERELGKRNEKIIDTKSSNKKQQTKNKSKSIPGRSGVLIQYRHKYKKKSSRLPLENSKQNEFMTTQKGTKNFTKNLSKLAKTEFTKNSTVVSKINQRKSNITLAKNEKKQTVNRTQMHFEKEKTNQEIVDHQKLSVIQDNKKYVSELLEENFNKRSPRKNKCNKIPGNNENDYKKRNNSADENTPISEKMYQVTNMNDTEHNEEYSVHKEEKTVPEQKSSNTKTVQWQKILNSRERTTENVMFTKNTVSSESCKIYKTDTDLENNVKIMGRQNKIINSQNFTQNTFKGERQCKKNHVSEVKFTKEKNIQKVTDKIHNARRKKLGQSLIKISKINQKKQCNDSFDSIQMADIVSSIQAIEINEQMCVENDTETSCKSIKIQNHSDEMKSKNWIDISPKFKKRKGRPKNLVDRKLDINSEIKLIKQKHNQMSVTQLKTPLKNKLYEKVPKKARKPITSSSKRNKDSKSLTLKSMDQVVAGNVCNRKDTTVFDFDDEYEGPVQLRCKIKKDEIDMLNELASQNFNSRSEDQNSTSQKTTSHKSPMKQITIKEMFQKLATNKKEKVKPGDNSGQLSSGLLNIELDETGKTKFQLKPPTRSTKNEEYDDDDDFFDDDSRAEWIPEEYAEYKFKYSAKKLKPLIYKCKICLMTLPTYLRLLKHKQTHVNATNPYECKQCKERFKKVDDLVAHLKVHKGEQPYKCNKCSDGFWTKDEYDRHRPIHILRKVKEAPKKYQCDLCGKAFVKLCDMDRHTRVHTGEKPCICNICGKRFQQSHNLSKHLIIHLHIKPYACEICNKQFSRPDVLSRHVLTHSVEKPFKCSVCPKTFIRQIQLNKHSQEHSKKVVKKN